MNRPRTTAARGAGRVRERSPLAAAIDVGTTGARAAAYDFEGRLVAEVRHSYRIRVPQPGWAEQDARDWAIGAAMALGRLAARVADVGSIRAIGLTGQCPTVVPVDGRGEPVGAGMLYRDNRAAAEAAEMRATIGEREFHRRTGHVPEAFHVGPKVLWLRRHDPAAFDRTRHFLQPRDVVLHRLTGVFATDETHANATVFYDLQGRHWDPELLDAFGISHGLFPDALPSWQVAAELPGKVAAEASLDRGIPVVIGAADSQCSAYGAGITGPGAASEMAGASSCLNSVVVKPLPDVRVTHYSYLLPHCYCTELGVNTTGAALDWAVRCLGYAGHAELAADAQRHLRMVARSPVARANPAEAAPLFLPYLGDGERDDPSVRGAFLGLSERHDRPALAFAAIEGVSLAVTAVLQVLGAGGSPVGELRVGGGSSRLALAGQLKAELLGLPVLHLDIDPAGFGAAMLAARSAGMSDESDAAVAAALGRARAYRPTAAGQERERARLDWFKRARADAAVHRAGESPAGAGHA
jgi:xylulokinase